MPPKTKTTTLPPSPPPSPANSNEQPEPADMRPGQEHEHTCETLEGAVTDDEDMDADVTTRATDAALNPSTPRKLARTQELQVKAESEEGKSYTFTCPLCTTFWAQRSSALQARKDLVLHINEEHPEDNQVYSEAQAKHIQSLGIDQCRHCNTCLAWNTTRHELRLCSLGARMSETEYQRQTPDNTEKARLQRVKAKIAQRLAR